MTQTDGGFLGPGRFSQRFLCSRKKDSRSLST
jgi:hypothetical protein